MLPVTLQATNTVATYTEANKRAIIVLNTYDKTMRKVFISHKTMRIFCQPQQINVQINDDR